MVDVNEVDNKFLIIMMVLIDCSPRACDESHLPRGKEEYLHSHLKDDENKDKRDKEWLNVANIPNRN